MKLLKLHMKLWSAGLIGFIAAAATYINIISILYHTTMTAYFHCPTPSRPLKRKILELDCVTNENEHKRSRVAHSPQPIFDWLLEIQALPRALSAPPSFGPITRLRTINREQADLSIAHNDMFRAPSITPSEVSRAPLPSAFGESSRPSTTSTTSRIGTGDRRYVAVLQSNGLRLDRTGLKMDDDIKQFVENHIIKERSSPPLSQEELTEVLEVADDIADNAEGVVLDLLKTQMFPTKRIGSAEGGNSQWTKDPLPSNTQYPCKLAAPKPDRHVGYPASRKSRFTEQENFVLNHPIALPYTQPAVGNTLPFLVVEMKAEPTGGTLWHAENQAAGSGAHCVNSMRWLLQQASSGPDDSVASDKALAFSMCVSARQAVLYIHFYSPQSKLYWMSFVDCYMPTNPRDVQKCNRHVKNILDYALGDRLTAVKDALGALFPYPEHWSNKKRASITANSTPATSFTNGELKQ